MCDLGLKRFTPDEVVVKLDPVRPAELDGAPIPGADVIGLEATSDVKGYRKRGHGRLKLLEVLLHVFPEYRWQVVSHDRREARFEVVDKDGPATQSPDPELLSSFQDGVVDLLGVRTGALKLVPDLAGHALAEGPDLPAVDVDLPGVHERDVADALASRLFDNVDRVGTGDLEVEPVVLL